MICHVLSNAMLCMENINLLTCVCGCVCESVYPSHFLSTRQQVRPLNGFLQLIDSLNDADLCKDVPFGDLDNE